MNIYKAIDIIEIDGTECFQEYLEAFSFIGKNGYYKTLQGFYGRTLSALIDEGYLDADFNIKADYE